VTELPRSEYSITGSLLAASCKKIPSFAFVVKACVFWLYGEVASTFVMRLWSKNS
jgi:hypothetical protein